MWIVPGLSGRESVIADLAELFKSFDDVEVAAVFGSLARNDPQVHDVDAEVKFSKRSNLPDPDYALLRRALRGGGAGEALNRSTATPSQHLYPASWAQ